MKVLLIGANGQLGTELRAECERMRWRVTPLTRDLLDIRDPHSIRKWLETVRPDWVINTAAYHRTDECEEHPEEAFDVNATAVFHLARETVKLGARLMHFSTDYVFDGTKRTPYSEEDIPNPLSVYGASKYAGELLARMGSREALVIRTSGMFGRKGSKEKGGNFIDRIVARARLGEPLKVVADVRFSPTYARDLAVFAVRLIKKKVTGIYHIVNQGETTWFEFAQAALTALGVSAEVQPVTLSELKPKATRPLYSVLGMNKLKSLGIGLPRFWNEALADYARAMRRHASE
ncbi:MAG: dTDP-4-dehydrorhamnose reductase [bacterium JZ-2024 1]